MTAVTGISLAAVTKQTTTAVAAAATVVVAQYVSRNLPAR
jgi:hypothetical protein